MIDHYDAPPDTSHGPDAGDGALVTVCALLVGVGIPIWLKSTSTSLIISCGCAPGG